MIQRLSKLQKQLLCLAKKNGGKVTNKQALTEIYGFPLVPGGRHVDRSQVSYPQYNSAAVAVVKSFNRIVRRELAERKYNFGIVLTDNGATVAKELKTNLNENPQPHEEKTIP